MMVDDNDDDDDEPSYAEEADALLAQMRQLRESMQQESGVLQQKAQASEQERTSSRLRSETWDARCLDRGRRGKHAVPDGRRRKRSGGRCEAAAGARRHRRCAIRRRRC